MNSPPDLLDKLRALFARVEARSAGQPRPLEAVIDDVFGPCEVSIEGRRTITFGSNNYFGLTLHPDVVGAATDALQRYGTATTGSRITSGTLSLHRALEDDLAQAYGLRHAAVFSTGYQANLAVVGALCGEGDHVVLDMDCHASIYDAVRLSGAKIVGFRHNAPDFLARQLSRLPAGARNRLVVVEGLYSVYGDLAPLRDILAACRDAGAYLMVDEAHSLGPYGTRGLGCVEDQGLLGQVDFIVGTFSKTLAGMGGFVVSNHDELAVLHMVARPYLFTASGSAANIAGVRAALRIVTGQRDQAERLWQVVHRVRDGVTRLGFRTSDTASPIVPLLAGDVESTYQVWRELLAAGLYVNLIAPPACRADACVLRLSCSSAHTDAQVDEALDVLGRVGRGAGLIA